MPKVPTLDGPRVQQGNLNVGRFSQNVPGREAFGGGQSLNQVNNATNNLTNTLNKIEKEEQSKADQIAILEADQQLSALETKMLYDPESGAMNKKGKDSFDLPNQVLPDFNKQANEIEKNLSNDYQRLSFRKMMASRSKHLDRQIGRHVSRETSKYDEDTTKSYVANEMNAAIQNFHDPERIQLALDRQRGALMSHADRNGLDAETTKQLVEQSQSKTHSAVVSKILNGGGTRQAKSYYDRYKDQITGQDRINVDKALKQGLLQADSQVSTDKIMASHGDDMRSALDKARSIGDPDKRDEVVKRVKIQFADKRAADNEADRQAFETAYQAVESNQSMDAVPKNILAEMSLRDKQALEKRASQLRNGLPVETDLATYYDLETMAGSPATRQAFMGMDLLKKKHLLSENDFKHFAKLQSSARSGKGVKEMDGIETKNSIVKSALFQAGIDTGKSASKEDNRRANLFKRKVDELVVQKKESSGKNHISNEEVRDIVDNLAVETVTGGGIFGFFQDKKRVFELTSEDRPLIRIDDIPARELEKIKSALNNMRIPVSDENVLKLYSEKLNSLGGGNG